MKVIGSGQQAGNLSGKYRSPPMLWLMPSASPPAFPSFYILNSLLRFHT